MGKEYGLDGSSQMVMADITPPSLHFRRARKKEMFRQINTLSLQQMTYIVRKIPVLIYFNLEHKHRSFVRARQNSADVPSDVH